MRLLVTGGAGFIGSAFVRSTLARRPDTGHPGYPSRTGLGSGMPITVLDKLTYAGNRQNLAPVGDSPRLRFVQGDICSPEVVREAMADCTHVVNFAAETHVDRSILDPGAFVRTDVEGTRVLLEAARDLGVERYLQVSTDEVYGEVAGSRRSRESDPLQPRSPYSASKAAGDLMVGAYHTTYGLPTLITRGSNTYGPYQYPEKLISLFITNALDGLPLPMYGDGQQVRDWLSVDDHCAGIAAVLERGVPGEIYNLGAANERPNREVIAEIVRLTGCDPGLVRKVPDRPGHDRRYALDSSKAHALGWQPKVPFAEGLEQTVRWYREHRAWWEPLKAGSFQEYYRTQYGRPHPQGEGLPEHAS